MSKSKHKYKDEDRDEGVVERKPTSNRHRDKRLDRALRTKNIDELMELEDDFNDDEPESSIIGRMQQDEEENLEWLKHIPTS